MRRAKPLLFLESLAAPYLSSVSRWDIGICIHFEYDSETRMNSRVGESANNAGWHGSGGKIAELEAKNARQRQTQTRRLVAGVGG